MDFFNSLTLDLKVLAVAIAGCALLALFSGNQKAEKRYMLVFVVLAGIGVYRFNAVAAAEEQRAAAFRPAPMTPSPPAKHVPLVSTSGK